MKYAFISFIVLVSCTPARKESKAVPISYNELFESASKFDTIQSVEEFREGDTVVFQSKSGSYYVLFSDASADSAVFSESEALTTPGAPAPPAGDNEVACTSDLYDGKDRRKAKLSVPGSASIVLNGLTNLLVPGFLKADSQLCGTIPTGPTSGRTLDENRNVELGEAWLYTFKREPDEDYHLILGTTNNYRTARFFTAEVSGLPAPTESSYSKIKKGRDDFESELGITACKGLRYTSIYKNNPYKVRISGALFFDAGHCSSGSDTRIGPAWARPKRYWEIHPVTGFKIL